MKLKNISIRLEKPFNFSNFSGLLSISIFSSFLTLHAYSISELKSELLSKSLSESKSESLSKSVSESKSESQSILNLNVTSQQNSMSIKAIPRTIIALYDKDFSTDIWYTRLHQYAEMPLNHLGLKLEYHDLSDQLPEISQRDDVLGVLVWFPLYSELKNPREYLAWGRTVIESGKKFVLMGTPGFYLDKDPLSTEEINVLLNPMGLANNDSWVKDTYDIDWVIKDKKVVEFERKYNDVMPPFQAIKAIPGKVTPHLVARIHGDADTDAVLVATSPTGGFAYEGYEKYEIFNSNENFRQWYINPFIFFNLAFDVSNYPKPDTTTLAGRRIYYSHIDGDGWNSVTEIEKYRKNRLITAEVVLHEIVEKYPQLPVTVAAIGADIDPEWMGTPESLKVLRNIFKAPNVEPASHTYSHPFQWSFFDQYTQEDEEPFLTLYPDGSWEGNSLMTKLTALVKQNDHLSGKDRADHLDEKSRKKKELNNYDMPRAYAKKPFDLNLETLGSINLLEKCTGAKVALYQWSGDCRPFFGAMKALQSAAVLNLNGGDTRYDNQYKSYAWVKPLGCQVGDLWQIYASMSNENTYTNLWRGPFFGFKFLTQTLKNTETPVRLKPINLYYHMYSGEKLASLQALHSNLEYIESQEIIPIKASQFAMIVNGFYDTKIIPLEGTKWRIEDRGALQTIRFDKSSQRSVDFSQSEGVIGQRYLQGSLYVALDPVHSAPVIALKEGRADSKMDSRLNSSLDTSLDSRLNSSLDHDSNAAKISSSVPYLIDSRWQIQRVKISPNNRVEFEATGYGPGEMKWHVSKDGEYSINWVEGPVEGWEVKKSKKDIQSEFLIQSKNEFKSETRSEAQSEFLIQSKNEFKSETRSEAQSEFLTQTESDFQPEQVQSLKTHSKNGILLFTLPMKTNTLFKVEVIAVDDT